MATWGPLKLEMTNLTGSVYWGIGLGGNTIKSSTGETLNLSSNRSMDTIYAKFKELPKTDMISVQIMYLFYPTPRNYKDSSTLGSKQFSVSVGQFASKMTAEAKKFEQACREGKRVYDSTEKQIKKKEQEIEALRANRVTSSQEAASSVLGV